MAMAVRRHPRVFLKMSTAAATTEINPRVNYAELTAAVIKPMFWLCKRKFNKRNGEDLNPTQIVPLF
jgi:hypothetical protein